MNKKLCFIMYVGGERYYPYIPLFLYCVGKAYPEYFTFIGVKNRLPGNIKQQIGRLDNSKFHIVSRVFHDYPDNPDVIKTLRWLWYLPEFEKFKAFYIGDIDILITRENPGIFERHSAICEKEELCYSNTTGIDPIQTRGFRMTGLHFAYSRPYFSGMRLVMNKYAGILRDSVPPIFINRNFGKFDNQHALAMMMKEAGIRIAFHKFFEYNGLHLGHSRVKSRWHDLFNQDPQHRAYFGEFVRYYYDPEFIRLVKDTTPEIRREIEKLIRHGEQLCLT